VSTEWLDPDEAFAEGEKERAERIRKHARPVGSLPLVGGPRHGGTYRVPLELLQRGGRFSFPILGQAHPENEAKNLGRDAVVRVHGEYVLDRGMMILRYESRR
jgi:hypothetical protein